MFCIFHDKMSAAIQEDKGINFDVVSENQHLAEGLHKPIIRKFEEF